MINTRLIATLGQLCRPSQWMPRVRVPLFGSPVRAGFPSPADDYIEDVLDLNELLIDDRAATFFCRVTGDSMVGDGIHDKDIVVVDRSKAAHHNDIVVAVLDNELTIKRLYRQGRRLALIPSNVHYPPIEIGGSQELHVWGVVTSCIKQFRR